MLPSSALPARRLRKTLDPLIGKAARESRADRYRKSFPAYAHAWMLVLHVMSGNASLRQSHAQQSADPELGRSLGMSEGWVSYSQLARSSASRPAECFERLLASLLRRARGRAGRRSPELLRGVRLVDSTFFALGGKASRWSVHGRHGPGVRLQALLEPTERLPEAIRMTTVAANDAKALAGWDLSGLEGRTLVFDLGYYSHRNLKRLLEGGVHFLTRLKGQARYRVSASRVPTAEGEPKTPEGDTVVSDETISLGSPNNRRGAVLEGVRLVTGENEKGEVHRFLTDRHDLSAQEVLSLYRKRWQIELFFRWLKRQLGALRPFGQSREAVWLTIVVAAIVAVLAALSEEWRPKGLTRVSWLRALGPALFRRPRFSG
jgi:Transposase DDE domain